MMVNSKKIILSSEITVLVPTINETTLEDVISSLSTQCEDTDIQILGFGDAEMIARKYGVGFVDFHKKTPKSIMLNYAVKKSSKEYFIVLDADTIPVPTWFPQMRNLFESNHQIFSGAMSLDSGNFWMKVYNYSLLHEFSMTKTASYRKHLAAFSLGFTKQFFVSNGGFDENLLRSQDYEWTLRAYQSGSPLFFSPNPVVIHIPVNKATFKSVLKYWFNAGKDNWIVRKKFEDVLHTPTLLKSPWVILLTAPFISLIPTFRLFTSITKEILPRFYLLPWIYLTKIAWCLGVFINSSIWTKEK